MNIPVEELKISKDYVVHKEGYRVVYFYEKYHEAPQGIYAKNVEDFMSEFKENETIPKYISTENILDRFLDRNKEAKGVAIYNVDGNVVLRKDRENIDIINNSEVYKEELIYDYCDVCHESGYRIVYLYEDHYHVSLYCDTLEGYMTNFPERSPIQDESDIPEFISVDDLLERFLSYMSDIVGVAIYKIDGTCIAEKSKKIK